MENNNLIKVGISVGDINGIGPEIILKTFSESMMMKVCIPVIYGSSKLFSFYRKTLNLNDNQFNIIKSASQAGNKIPNLINVWEEEARIETGQQTETGGQYAFKSLEKAVSDLKNSEIDALVTAPINKKNIQNDKFNFAGHTEFLADQAGKKDYLMLLCNNDLRVGTVTGHIPVSDVSMQLSQEKIIAKARVMLNSLLQDFRIRKPKIAVLGLNPHNGDNGLMGSEEQNIIIPAIEKLKAEGHIVMGPFAADGFFGSGSFTKFDGILSMYHDQGLVPFKTIAFGGGVNFTAGLPFVRTSPDHGVGYDIAGLNKASEQSFREAIYAAVDIVKCREEFLELSENPLAFSKPNRNDRRSIEFYLSVFYFTLRYSLSNGFIIFL
jgi:4-hydroxythreonine-4-phosphate dehydrogenase